VIEKQVTLWGQKLIGEKGYSSIGAVVGPNADAKKLRQLMPHTLFLVPGYGSQGATAKDVVDLFDEKGYGAIISSSRDIIYARQDIDFAEAARKAAIQMRDDVVKIIY
jgi:Orotidine-5''-phosphate decarboxylase